MNSEKYKQERKTNFFISYTEADLRWAEWIAHHIEEAGYSTSLEAWDFKPGSNFVREVKRAVREAERIIIVLSEHYLSSYCANEYQVAAPLDMAAQKVEEKIQETIIPIIVQKCALPDALEGIKALDLSELGESQARDKLLDSIEAIVEKGRLKPMRKTFDYPAAKPSHFPGALPVLWSVPFGRDPHSLIGHTGTLKRLQKELISTHIQALYEEPPESNQTAPVIGRQTAVEYIYRYQSDYEAIIWIRAHSYQALLEDCVEIAARLNLAEKNAPDKSTILQAVKTWLERQAGWLLVIDNVKDPFIVEKFLPKKLKGHILITTRELSMNTIAHLLPLSFLEAKKEEYLRYLSQVIDAALLGPGTQRHRIKLDGLTIGSARDNDIMLIDPSVLPHHAEIRFITQKHWIKASTGKILLNGQDISTQQCPLTAGDTLQIGPETFVYEGGNVNTERLVCPLCGQEGRPGKNFCMRHGKKLVPALTSARAQELSMQEVEPVSGTILRTYREHNGAITGIAWSLDTRYVVSTDREGMIQIWDPYQSTAFYTGNYGNKQQYATAVTWSPDGKSIATASNEGYVATWLMHQYNNLLYNKSTYGNSNRNTEPFPGFLTAAWSPDGKYIAAAGFDCIVRVWDVATTKLVSTYQQHTDRVNSLSWFPGGLRRIASGSSDGTIKIWDILSHKLVSTYIEHQQVIYTVAWSPDGMYIASAGEDKAVRVWKAQTGETVHIYIGHTNWVRSLAWSRKSDRIASASKDETVHIWHALPGQTAQEGRVSSDQEVIYIYKGHRDEVHCIAWSPDNKLIATGGGLLDKTVQVWVAE